MKEKNKEYESINSKLDMQLTSLHKNHSKQNEVWKDLLRSKEEEIENLKRNELNLAIDDKNKVVGELERYKETVTRQAETIESLKNDVMAAKLDSESKVQQIIASYEEQINKLTSHSDVRSVEAFYKQKLLVQKVCSIGIFHIYLFI